MAAANYTLFIPRANFLPGTGATPPKDMTKRTEANMAGTSRPPFVIDDSLWSSLKIKANSPDKTIRTIVIVGDGAWALTHYSADAAFAAGFPVAANQPFSIENTQEDFMLYVAAATGTSVNLYVWCTR